MSVYQEESVSSSEVEVQKGVYDSGLIINSKEFDYVVTKLRLFLSPKVILKLIHKIV